MSEYDRETSINGNHGPTRGRSATRKKNSTLLQEMREMILLRLVFDELSEILVS